jgi:hypothetical protein
MDTGETKYKPISMYVRDDVIPIFSSLLEMNSELVLIKKAGSTTVFGSISEVYCSIFEYYMTMKCSSFREASETKTLTLLEHYSDEQCEFFVRVIPTLFLQNLKLSYQELVWLMKFFDDFIASHEIAELCFQKIYVCSSEKIKLLNCIVEQVAGKMPGKWIGKLLEIAIGNIQFSSMNEVGKDLFTYSFGRNIIIQILKSDKYECNNETELFLGIVKKIKEINSDKDSFKVSEKAFFDFMACCRWFYIDKRKILEKLEEITYIFPNFKMTSTMEKAFRRRAKLVESYDEIQGTFKYNMKIHKQLDARDCYAYCQKTSSGSIRCYSTGKYPEPIQMSLTVRNKKRTSHRFIIIKNENEIVGKKLFIDFLLTEKDGTKIIEKKWSFNGTKPLYIPYSQHNGTFIITIQKALYINE